eukprot:11121421-Ditylum_brightwellii.AAC.1
MQSAAANTSPCSSQTQIAITTTNTSHFFKIFSYDADNTRGETETKDSEEAPPPSSQTNGMEIKEQETILPVTLHLPTPDTEHDAILPLKENIIQCFVDLWDVYLVQADATELLTHLTCFVTEKLSTKATK